MGSYDLKEPFLRSVCQRAPQQTQSQVSLVRLAELMRACMLRAGSLMFWVAGSLCFLSFPACPTSKMKGELRSRCFEACIYTEFTLFIPFSIPRLSFAFASALGMQRGSISLSLYPTKHTKSPHFIHIIMMSIIVGNFLSPLTSSVCLPASL